MYFCIIHFEIASRLSIGIKICDLWMTLNGSITADERHLRGSWFLCGLHSLAENWFWARDVEAETETRHWYVSRSSLFAFWVHCYSFECLSPEYCALQQHLWCYCWFCCLCQWLTASVYTVTVTINHRRSQDFVWGALFFHPPPKKKVDDLFSVVAVKTHAKTA